ncbi:class I SAM-dependent methyltransferase [Nocardioides sp. 616]|uniref:class I SAM-dependent methyltransferase n=1 Tax=Nocardioides sp. 616 TaxID=2268090 RepID=UPI000CE49EFC|nr:class I SAM-dependent methyltransferase [Nocardioides sp. 616]
MDRHHWDARYAEHGLVWRAGPNEFVAAELSDLQPGRAVDLGAGEGRNALWLAERGWRVTAVDFSLVGLEKGRQLAGDLPVSWVCADATTWVSSVPVDLVVLAYLQLPAAARRAAIRNAFSSLAAGGTLLVVAHDATNLTEGTGGPQDASVLMTAEDLLADLDGFDLEVLRADRVARRVAAPEGDEPHRGQQDRTAWDALLRVTRR